MNPKKYQKGDHVYIHWKDGTKEVKKIKKNKKNKKNTKLKINIDEETAMGKYVNIGSVNHKREEFILDFIFLPPGTNKGKVRSRLITSPGHAKRLQKALQENIKRYEKKYGKISDTKSPEKQIGF